MHQSLAAALNPLHTPEQRLTSWGDFERTRDRALFMQIADTWFDCVLRCRFSLQDIPKEYQDRVKFRLHHHFQGDIRPPSV